MSQDACCAAVRRFLSERLRESLVIDVRPDVERRNENATEEVWRSPSHALVVEHTRVEAFKQQIQDGVAFQRLVDPIQQQLAGTLPGRFASVSEASRCGFIDISVWVANE